MKAPLDYALAARRARALWSRALGSWAEDAAGRAVNLWAAEAVTFNRAGAILRAIEEQVGRGQATSRHYSTVTRRLPAILPATHVSSEEEAS